MEVFSATNLAFILRDLVGTILISVLAIIFSAHRWHRAGLVADAAADSCACSPSSQKRAYIELFRCTPNLLWILFVYFTVNGNDVLISVLAFTLFTSAVMAEIVRNGLAPSPRASSRRHSRRALGSSSRCGSSSCPRRFARSSPRSLARCTRVSKDSHASPSTLPGYIVQGDNGLDHKPQPDSLGMQLLSSCCTCTQFQHLARSALVSEKACGGIARRRTLADESSSRLRLRDALAARPADTAAAEELGAGFPLPTP